MEDREFVYYAFISYSHKDEKWAKWLQQKLEHYRLPTVIRKESGKVLPKRIAPIFRDATDLTVGKLNDNLHRELEQSRYLIVICSPNSAGPNREGMHFVDGEVEYFSSLGRDDRIIPVIIDGVPGDSVRECFCPKVKELGLMGLDATKHSRARILSDIVAKILSLRPDVLWQREKRRVARQRFWLALGGCFLLALLTGGGWLACDWFCDHVEYYEDYIDCWGLPTGVGRLTQTQIRPRNAHYRFVYRKRDRLFGRRILREVIHCNSAGYPRELEAWEPDRLLWQRIGYNTELELQYIDSLERNGQLRERRIFSGKGASVIDFKKKDSEGVLIGNFQSASLNLTTDLLKNNSAEIRRWRIERDRLGHPVKEFFFRDDISPKPARNADGIFGVEYSDLGHMGQMILKSYLDQDATQLILKDGTKAILYCYEKNSLQSIITLNGSAKKSKKVLFSRDQYGNVVAKTHFIGEKIVYKDGYAKMKMSYDNQGNLIKQACYDIDENPCLCKDGYATLTMGYDAGGNLIERAFYDLDEMPCFHKDGYAKEKMNYDSRGYLIKKAYYGVDGRLCLNKFGFAQATCSFDDQGKPIELKFYGVDGKLCLNKYGVAKMTCGYDVHGNITKIVYYGVDGKPCLHKETGIAQTRISYDYRGNQIEQSYYGIDGNPCLHKYSGIACVAMNYDEYGNRVELVYYGIDGKPCLHKETGIAQTRISYDYRGNQIEQFYYGIDGNPCTHKGGFARVRMHYDARGNKKGEAYYDVDGKPCLDRYGVGRTIRSYDDSGNLTVLACYDIDGSLCVDNGLGYAKATWQYDERGNQIEEAYYAPNDKHCLNQAGFAKVAMRYDERGNLIENVYYGVDGKPAVFAKGTGCYDARGNRIEEAYYGVDGKPYLLNGCAKKTYRYDARGNRIETAFYGIDGKPCWDKNNVSKVTYRYDDRGNCIEEAYYGADGKPCLHKDGNAKVTYRYDDRGNCIEEAYYGVDGKQCLHKDGGFFKVTMSYDERGNQIEAAFFGADGKPCLCSDGFAKMTMKYDERDNCIQRQIFDAAGKLLRTW